MTNFEMVKEFQTVFCRPMAASPEIPSEDLVNLRLSLIREELNELHTAILQKDVVEAADALTDLLYVIYGCGATFGMDLDKCFLEVHRTNMAKLGANGKPILRGDGKILKPEGWSPPNLANVLFPTA